MALAFLIASATSLPARGVGPNDILVHHPVATNVAPAQQEFDRGLSLIYAFNPEEALTHFQQAARLDPSMAMAYWGIALSAGPNVNTPYDLSRASIGRDAVTVASRLTTNDLERRYIAALAKRYDATQQSQIFGAEAAYAAAMREVSRQAPNDLDAATLFAESLMDLTPLDMWRRDGSPNRYTREVIATLQRVLARDSNHVGANHYLIHAYEGSNTPQTATASARRLSSLDVTPAAEHLVHMPTHIFIRIGDQHAAIDAGARAVALCRSYLAGPHAEGHDGYFHHDLQVLNYAYMMAGQWEHARATADEIAAQVNDSGAAVETYVRFRRWGEVLKLAPPSQPGVRWRFAQAMANAASGRLNAARDDAGWFSSLHDCDPRTAIARDVLDASIAARSGQNGAAVAALRRAVTLQDALRRAEPPQWFYPIRESLGGRLLLARRFDEARRVFEDDLRENPGNPRSLFGLARALQPRGPKRSREVEADYRRAWRGADTQLTVEAL